MSPNMNLGHPELSQIIEGNPVATIVIDSQHRITHWNRACSILTGTPASQMIGTNRQWAPFYPSARPIMADLIIDQALENAISQFYSGKFRPSAIIPGAYEAEDYFPMFGEDGCWLYFTAAVLKDASGQIVGAIETLQDVTARHRAEEALKRSEERYKQLSMTDALTGLYNSRHLREQLKQEMLRASRYNHPLSLLVIDADDFKKINDTYGHLEGDQVLQSLASVLKHCLRTSDSAYRYGGEEFVVLLPETDLEGAALIGNRCREMFAQQVVESEQGLPVQCTISVGASLYHPGETASDFICRADAATYEAKSRGKNCLVSHA